MPEPAVPPTAPYEADFYAWTQDQARRLREAAAARVNLPLDFENLAEEVESMGRSQASAVRSHLARVVEHLLKLGYSPAVGPRAGWRQSVSIHRVDALDELVDSPGLRPRLELARAYAIGRAYAVAGLEEDGVAGRDLPSECPYTLDQVLDPDGWPANRHGLE